MTDLVTADAGIRQLQSRYTDAVWRWDMEAFGDCFTDDAEWRVVGEQRKGRAACVALLEEVKVNFDRVLFLMITPILQVGDGVASGRTYVTEQNVYKDRRPGFSIGVYYDRFVQQGDRWRFSYHHFVSHYLGAPDMTGRFFESADFGPPPGMPGPDDPATPSAETIFNPR
jgi:ketosteroid isomerase-like protein